MTLLEMLALLTSYIFLAICSAQKVDTVEELLAQPIPEEANKLSGKALVDYVNSRQSFFKAKYSPEAEQRLEHLMRPEFIRNARTLYNVTKAEKPILNDIIPESFDARKEWKNCSSITYIRDQSKCGSCWAVSAAETMSDRICVQTRGKVQKLISDVDILACCGDACGEGCEGGYDHKAWEFAKEFGVCTGGRFQEQGVCKPYPFHPCGFYDGKWYNCPRDHLFKTPACKKYCQYGYGKRYDKDKVYAKSVYILDEDEKAIQREMMKNGPVQAAFIVYEDFSYYTSGIYVHKYGRQTGGHAVKVVGWGVDKWDGTKYWIVANSWGSDWGENGYFRILRGVNHCEFESYVVSGEFRV
ncbi:hypothetical protein V3C99_005973 [Haemonchus contortus]